VQPPLVIRTSQIWLAAAAQVAFDDKDIERAQKLSIDLIDEMDKLLS